MYFTDKDVEQEANKHGYKVKQNCKHKHNFTI